MIIDDKTIFRTHYNYIDMYSVFTYKCLNTLDGDLPNYIRYMAVTIYFLLIHIFSIFVQLLLFQVNEKFKQQEVSITLST